MAAYIKFFDFVEQLLLGKHDFSAAGHVYKAYLTNATPDPAADTIKADLAEIPAGNGYLAGGVDVQNTLVEAGGVVTVGATDVVFAAVGGPIGPFRYVVLYNDTQTIPEKPLVAYWDYGPGGLTLLDTQTLTVDFTMLFTMA